MNCEKCGVQIDDDSRFCRHCGVPQKPEVPAAADEPNETSADKVSKEKMGPNSSSPSWMVAAGVIGSLLLIILIAIRNPSQRLPPVANDTSAAASDSAAAAASDAAAAATIAAAMASEAAAEAAVAMGARPRATSANPSDLWSYSSDEDKVRTGTTYYASVTSSNRIHQAPPYDSDTSLEILVRKSPANGTDVLMILSSGQLMCPSYEGCHGTVRFDEGPPERVSFNGSSDNSSDTIFVEGAKSFIAKLKKANRAVVEIEIYQAGRPQFEFDVRGLKWEH